MSQRLPMNLFDRLSESIDKAIAFLHGEQLPCGQFKTLVGRANCKEEECQFDSSPFTTTFVVYSLSFVDDARALQMQDKALDFLEREGSPPGLWRFWTKDKGYRSAISPVSIPPDLDDTCCASFVLKKYRKQPNNLKLILANRNPNGLFYTWFLPRFNNLFIEPKFWLQSILEIPSQLLIWKNTEAEPGDVDCAVNANALLYLGEREETKAAIEYLIDITLKGEDSISDKWYLSKFVYYYMLSRAYFNGIVSLEAVKDVVVHHLETQLKQQVGSLNPLDAALGICSLLNYQEYSKLHSTYIEQIITNLIESQFSTGGWSRIALYYGGPKQYYGWGSQELTAAFCLEALARYACSLVES